MRYFLHANDLQFVLNKQKKTFKGLVGFKGENRFVVNASFFNLFKIPLLTKKYYALLH